MRADRPDPRTIATPDQTPPRVGAFGEPTRTSDYRLRFFRCLLGLALLICSDLRADSYTLDRILDGVIIPEIAFENRPVWECLKFIGALKTADTDIAGVSIVLLPLQGEHPKVTLTMRNATIRRALTEVCRSAGLTFKSIEYAVIVGERIPENPLLRSRGRPNPIPDRWQRIILPKFELHDATLNESLAFISRQSRVYDTERRGISFSSQTDLPNAKTVTLSCYDIPCSELLLYLSATTGIRYEFSGDEIRVFPK
jgi:hypothetical protein